MTNKNHPHLYALIAGENSGDTLGAGLMKALRRHDPKAQFIGVGGPKMIALGLNSEANMEDLAVMGIVEVLVHLPKILSIRNKVTRRIIEARPCVLIGIDAPDFNLTVEMRVRAAGIPTIHYVSPSVWAWREGRMKKIRRACDCVLALLPFEKDFYDKQQLKCVYVGHTLANTIPLKMDQENARLSIDLYRTCVENIEPHKTKIMGILPGSRYGVISNMLPVYAQVARMVKEKLHDIVFISSVPSYTHAQLLKDAWLEHAPDLSLTIYVGNTLDMMASCDAILLTSGTVALEVTLAKIPFCVAYKVNPLTAALARRLLKVDTFSLPNLISGHKVVSEYIQENCTAENLTAEMVKLLTSDNLLMKKEFYKIHEAIRCNSDELAANAVFDVIKACGHNYSEEEEAEHQNYLKVNANANRANIEPEVTLPDASVIKSSKDKTEPKF
jgi:lipid-A-disaccharide synthase